MHHTKNITITRHRSRLASRTYMPTRDQTLTSMQSLDLLLNLNNSIPKSHKTPASWPPASPAASHKAYTWTWPNLHEISPRYPSPSIGAIAKVVLKRISEFQWRGRWLEAFHLDPVSIRSEVVVRGRRGNNEICRCSIVAVAAAAVVTRRSRKTRRPRYERTHKLTHKSDRSVRPCLPKRPRAARIAKKSSAVYRPVSTRVGQVGSAPSSNLPKPRATSCAKS